MVRLALLTSALLCVLTACIPSSARRITRIDRNVEALQQGQGRMLANQDRLMAGVDELVEASRRDGTAEITLYFPWRGDRLRRGTAQHDRLVAWLDHLVMHARGREILLASIGSATDWRRRDWNEEVSVARAWSPKPVIARHLVNVPHRWVSSVGTGDREVPPDAGGRTWRHVRILAAFDEAQLPGTEP